MDRVSGTYKRRTQRILMILALLLCFATNADTFEIVRTLWESPALRQDVVAAAETETQKHDQTSGEQASLPEPRGELSTLKIPLGWYLNQPLEQLNDFSRILGPVFTPRPFRWGRLSGST